MTGIEQIAERHFGKSLVKKLSKQGITFNSLQGTNNGDTTYVINNNGIGQVKTFNEIIDLGK